VLLLTWNFRFYLTHRANRRYRQTFDGLLISYQDEIVKFRVRSIDSYSRGDDAELMPMFRDFAKCLGPVGAAKALHVEFPQFRHSRL